MMKMNKSIFVMQCRLSSVDDDDAGLKLWFSSISVYSLWFWTFIYRLIRRHLNVELKTKTSPMCAGGSHLVDEHIKKNMQIRLNRLLNWMIELQCGWSHSIAASFSLFASSSVGYATSNNFSFSTSSSFFTCAWLFVAYVYVSLRLPFICMMAHFVVIANNSFNIQQWKTQCQQLYRALHVCRQWNKTANGCFILC